MRHSLRTSYIMVSCIGQPCSKNVGNRFRQSCLAISLASKLLVKMLKAEKKRVFATRNSRRSSVFNRWYSNFIWLQSLTWLISKKAPFRRTKRFRWGYTASGWPQWNSRHFFDVSAAFPFNSWRCCRPSKLDCRYKDSQCEALQKYDH